jgi:hypothetical protein
MSWHFRSLAIGEKTREPIQGEFFSTEAIHNPTEALVREGIQNSLDAGTESPVRVSGVVFLPRTRLMFQLRRSFVSRSLFTAMNLAIPHDFYELNSHLTPVGNPTIVNPCRH